MGSKLKNLIVDGVLKAFSLLPMKKIILFESSPDFACNTYPVYEALKNSKELGEKWRLMWFISNEKFIPDGFSKKDTIYLTPNGLKETLRHLYYRAVSAAMITANRNKNPVRKRQLTVFLGHGSSVKRTKGIYETGHKIDYVLCQAPFFDDILCYQFDVTPAQLIHTGYPRCDELYHSCPKAREIFSLPKDSKLVMWLPTYRKHKNQTMEQEGSAGIPIIKTKEAFNALSDFLEKNNITLVLKPHPAEDLSAFEFSREGRFKVITDEFLAENKLRLYQILSEADAMITDYSSVFYDFLICDKPVAITTDDAEGYKNTRGFAFDVVTFFSKAAVELPDVSSLYKLLEEISKGVDNKKEGRKELRDITSQYQDDRSAERMAKFIIEKLKA